MKTAAKWLAGLALLAALGVSAWVIGNRLWWDNLHTVVDGELYRSAQMDDRELAGAIDRLGVRSVVNLRGENSGHEWYRREVALCAAKNVAHFDVRLGAKKMPTPGQLARLVAVFQTAPRPLLIHCHSGSDRTGFASALYLVVVRGETPADAIRALSLRFGHMAWFGYEEQDEFFSFYEKSKLPNFSEWLEQIYPEIYRVEKIENQWVD